MAREKQSGKAAGKRSVGRKATSSAKVAKTVNDAKAALQTLKLNILSNPKLGKEHWDGFSLVDAAAVLGRRPATVRSRYHRARQRLRTLLEDQGALNSVQ